MKDCTNRQSAPLFWAEGKFFGSGPLSCARVGQNSDWPISFKAPGMMTAYARVMMTKVDWTRRNDRRGRTPKFACQNTRIQSSDVAPTERTDQSRPAAAEPWPCRCLWARTSACQFATMSRWKRRPNATVWKGRNKVWARARKLAREKPRARLATPTDRPASRKPQGAEFMAVAR